MENKLKEYDPVEKLIELNKSIFDQLASNFYELKYPDQKVMFLNQLKDCILNPLKEKYKELENDYMNQHKADKVFIGETMYCVGNRKTNRYETAAIYKACQGNFEQLVAILPKNPAFNKTTVLKLQESSGTELWHEDVKDVMEIKPIPKRLLKEVNNGKQITNN